MIAKDRDTTARHDMASDPAVAEAEMPSGLPITARIRRGIVPPGRPFDVLVVPAEGDPADSGELTEQARLWAAAAGAHPDQPASPRAVPVIIPLYGCHVIWSPARGVVLGPADQG